MKYSEFRIKVSSNRKKDEASCRNWLKSITRFQFQVKGKRQIIPIKHITHEIDDSNDCFNKIKNALIDIDTCYEKLEKIQRNIDSKINRTTIKTLISKLSNSDLEELPTDKIEELKKIIKRFTKGNQEYKGEQEYIDLEITLRNKVKREEFSLSLTNYFEELNLQQFNLEDNRIFIDNIYGVNFKDFLINRFKFNLNEITDEPGDFDLGKYYWSGRIEIFLDIIYSFANRFKLDPYILYRKVLIHELAHAYHHRGIDATGGIWDSFGNSYHDRKKVVEGLANWHCMHYMIKLDVESGSVKNLYTLLCCSKVQPLQYRQFIKWSSFSYENIRNRIYHARKENRGRLSFKYFDDELKKCHNNGE